MDGLIDGLLDAVLTALAPTLGAAAVAAVAEGGDDYDAVGRRLIAHLVELD